VARKNAVDSLKAEADCSAANVLPIIREAHNAGARTLREIAKALNARRCARQQNLIEVPVRNLPGNATVDRFGMWPLRSTECTKLRYFLSKTMP
jgi:hypothetical protein